MSSIPRDSSPDSTLALLTEGYTFVSTRCRRYDSDLFETRLMLRKAVCILGEEAAQVFYEPGRFTRHGAMPKTTLTLLQDEGSVQLLDGEAHRRRKEMFMSIMTPAHVRRLADASAAQWQAHLSMWENQDDLVLLDAVRHLLCHAVCTWAGIPLAEPEAAQRTREFGAMIDGAGAVGPRNWQGQLLRARTERWGREVIEQIRSGRLTVPDGSAAHVIATHRAADGALLDTKVAAVELLNVLRPTIAIARFITFAALALHDRPACWQTLREDDAYVELFVQEVRRFYPFFPLIGGCVREAFDWRGYRFTLGTWVLLDLYGTNHDARIWDDPDTFRPERFRDWKGSTYTLIPQGAGDHYTGHRCAGEWITIGLMKTVVRFLTESMQYEVPEQDLRINLSSMPAIPKSRFILSKVRRIP